MAGELRRSAAAVDKLIYTNVWTLAADDQDKLARSVVESWRHVVAHVSLSELSGACMWGWPYVSLIVISLLFAEHRGERAIRCRLSGFSCSIPAYVW